LYSTTLFGFDSESKPTFNKGEVQTGPHLIQLSTLKNAYLFQVNAEILIFLAPILSSSEQIKIGFGLKNDMHLFRKKNLILNNIIDLSKCFGHFGLNNPIGVKNAMALLFQVNFPKSRTISTSNWARKILSKQQIAYAAADAYAPVLIYQELQRLGITLNSHFNTSHSSISHLKNPSQPTNSNIESSNK
jgi:ribonuclease D